MIAIFSGAVIYLAFTQKIELLVTLLILWPAFLAVETIHRRGKT